MPLGELAISDEGKRGIIIKRRLVLKNGHKLFAIAFLIAISAFTLCNAENGEVTSTIIPTSSSSESSFDCRQSGQECLHDGICSSDGSNCDCSPSPNWFGRQCELRRCAQRHNPCENGAECEKTEQSFRCHCPIGFGGIYCEKQLPTICDGLEHPCLHGNCRLGQSIHEYRCECYFGWTGLNCTEIDYCAEHNNCLNGNCVNGANGQHCECRSGWGGEYCELDVDECQAGAMGGGICKNDGKCQNRLGYFFCQCPDGFVGQFCERQNGPDQCEPSPCQNGGKCGMEISATTAIWALAVKQFDWKWECECPNSFEGPRCEQIVDDCSLGRMTCVNGGQCVRPWMEQIVDESLTEIIHRKWHPAECKCPIGFQGEFCELDVNECEQFGGRICKNGATCMNRHGSFACLCVGGFDGKYCENNIDDCVDNLCYFGSTCVDGISRYNCLCAPDRVGNLCEYANPCFGANNPCVNGQCFADAENGNYSCQCQDGWTGRNCSEDVDECASGSTNRCFNGKCVNEEGGFRCECEFGYTDELCMSLVKYCDANPCQNGATCLNDLGRYDCICLPGYSGKRCEVRAYQDLNKCYLECQNGGICRGPNAEKCECPPPYAGILCEIEKPDPCEQNECAHGSICAPNIDYISYSCQCPPFLGGQFCERRLAPCEYNPCLHGICRIGGNTKDEDYTCECLPEWTGKLCDRSMEDSIEEDGRGEKCPLATNPCQNGGQCIGGQNEKKTAISSVSTFFECICPRGFVGPLCEEKLEEHYCGNGCRNGGKCERQKDDGKWICQCPIGYEGMECEIERNACLNVSCEHKGKCVNLGAMEWRCDCAPGWSGEKCELEVNECMEMNIICLNEGICVDRPNNYRCECTKGYAGRHCEISVPVDKFDRTDLVDLENCNKQGCQQKSGNAKCDPECNYYVCSFDGGDCSTKQSDPFVNCPQSSFCAHVFADEKCDEVCNNERCLFDGFDCVPRPLAKCPRLAECALRYANGRCDEQCNMAACGWDGGDCDREAEPDPVEQPQILPGELMLVLAVNSSQLFPNLLRQFLLSLSAYLRASLALSMESNGQEMKPKLFEWRSDLGIGQRIQIPSELNAISMFSVHYEEGKRRRKRLVQNDEVNEIIHGVAIFLRVDVTMCNAILQSTSNSSLAQKRQNNNSSLLGVHSPCFSNVENVAAYVGVAIAKKTLQDIGVPILEARRAPPIPATPKYGLYVLSLCLVSILSGALTVMIVKRKRTPANKKSAKTWRPPIFEQQNSKFGGSTSTLRLANNSNLNGQINEYCWNANYPGTTGVSCASSNASSNIPLMISHASSMVSLCSQSQQQPQMGNNNIYCNPPHIYHQPQIGRPTHPLQPSIYGQTTEYGQQYGHHQHFMGPTHNNQQQFFQNHNLAQTHQNNNANMAIVGPCSRSSSSGIGGSSTEHSPLGHHNHPIPHQNVLPLMNEEEKAKMHLLAELREFAVMKKEGLLECKIELEAWKVNANYERRRTLLHLLFQNEHLMRADDEQTLLANIDVLFKAGISVNAQDEDGTTALSLAVRNRKYLIVKKLVKECEANPNLEDYDGKTPIYHCCANLPTKEDAKIAEFLIKEIKEEIGVNKLAKRMDTPETPLMRCAILRNPISLQIGRMILERIEPNQRMEFVNQTAGETLKTALHFAAAVGNAEMVKLLVANGANKDAVDKEGRTPLFMATEHGQFEAIAALLEMGADRNKSDMSDTKILEIAMQPGYELIAELFEQFPENCHPQHFHHRQNNQLQQQAAKTSKLTTTIDGGNGTIQRRQKGGLKRTAAAANVAILEKSSTSRPLNSSASGIGSSAPKRAAIEHNVPSESIQPETASSNIPQNENNISPPSALAPCGSQSQSQCSGGGTSSSLLTPPNSDQSNYSATPSPNHPPQQNAAFPPNRAYAGMQPNSALSIPSIPRLKCTTQMEANATTQFTVRQLPSTNQSIRSSPWSSYYSVQPILPIYHQRHSNSNFTPSNIHQLPQSSLAQYSAAISSGNPSVNFIGNFHGHQQLDQPEFLRSSLDHLFPSPQDDKILESTEAIRPPFTNPLDFRTQLNFGIPTIGFPNGGNVDLGEQQPQNGGNNLSNSLTHLDQISENELLPKDISQALSNYVLNIGGGGGIQQQQQQQMNWPFPEQSSPEN